MKLSNLSLIAAVLGAAECSAFFGSLTRMESFANIHQKDVRCSTRIFMGELPPPPAGNDAVEYVAAAPNVNSLECKVTSWISGNKKNALAEKMVVRSEDISEKAVVREAATVEIPVSMEDSTDVEIEAAMTDSAGLKEDFLAESTIQDAKEVVVESNTEALDSISKPTETKSPSMEFVADLKSQDAEATTAVLIEDSSFDSKDSEKIAAQEEPEIKMISQSANEQPLADSHRQPVAEAPEVIAKKKTADSKVAFPEFQKFVDAKDEPNVESTAPEIAFDAAATQVEPDATFEEEITVSQTEVASVPEVLTTATESAEPEVISVSTVEVIHAKEIAAVMEESKEEILVQEVLQTEAVNEKTEEESLQVVASAPSVDDPADSPETTEASQV